MSIKNLITVVCVAAAVLCFSDNVDAQRSPLKVNQGFRWMGAFQSTGYHWRTPGPCVGYYNPYSQHNSALRIGGTPQGAESYVGNGYGYSDYYGGFDQPGSYGNHAPMQPTRAGTTNSVDSEIDNDEYENDDEDLNQDEDYTDEDVEADAKSILDEIEAIDQKNKADSKDAERVDGASLWSDVFELSKLDPRSMDRRSIERRAAYNVRNGKRK